ncbi:MAG: hypothetical protein MUC48_02420 [Leptolyngbya sp. Prado105]|nr:hypothetical protein [Leptolyngbya sp. Prado105]
MVRMIERSKSSDNTITTDAIVYSQLGDQLFNELASRMATRHDYRLLFEHTLDQKLFQQIRVAAATYISACLGSPLILSEAALVKALLEARGKLSNHTGTGLLVPKREHTLEFNAFQKSIATAFSSLDANDLIDAVDLPVNLRVMYGEISPEKLKLPFNSAKRHSDVWAGVHPDATVVVLPLFGDIEHLTIEAGEMPREMELGAMRIMSDFDEGKDIPMVKTYEGAQLQHGTMYFNDARGLHQTVRRRLEGVRISVDFRFRRKFNDVYRAMVPPLVGGIEEDNSVPYEEWLKVGRETMIVFDESIHQMKHDPTAPVPLYNRGYRTVPLFQD